MLAFGNLGFRVKLGCSGVVTESCGALPEMFNGDPRVPKKLKRAMR